MAASASINSIRSDKSGNIYAAGNFAIPLFGEYVAEWNGTTWNAVEGTDSLRATVGIDAIIFDAAGNLHAAGYLGSSSNGSYAAKWDGAGWNFLSMQSFPYSPPQGSPYAVAIDSTGNLFFGGNINDNNFDYFVAEYAASALPIKLISFNVTTQNSSVLLQWQTTQEENSSYFNIQRSTDGKSFSNISKVAAVGNSSITKKYSYLDENVAYLNSNSIFYRLAETDIDGATTYSQVREVNIAEKGLQFSVYPNPATDFVKIAASVNSPHTLLRVTDMNGRTLYETNQSFVAGQQFQLSLTQFPKQILIISVVSSGNHKHFKVLNE